ncbi:hypothetical protein [Macrococcus equipercicus]|uniref:YjcQ protein n=1 Tax=Macrococcus equipercicus TaxID=69967 RepID=A0A9Q9BNW7_9STAP|nr:hypothetical protein [Macrococcus equipercicus]KAA1040045.1 hypothetical protein ERX35_003395 [Macrococcus equipercicus]UTH13006.1 hypothetical protein KFV11_06910 [Macrococcus equipercicus]
MNLNEDVLYNYLDSISKEGTFNAEKVDVQSEGITAELDYLFDNDLVDGDKAAYQQNGEYVVSSMSDLKLTQQGQSMLEKLENRW